jgi:hypothetical protein
MKMKIPEGLEIIPTELLVGLTVDQMDFQNDRLTDNQGRLWIDIRVDGHALTKFISGKRIEVRLCGRRAPS